MERYMQEAIALAENARYLSPPNPWVGCVIVKEGHIIGGGWTQPPGMDHAEVQALHQVGENAKGADVYVTLEPCSHFGRTPPCADALIRAQVKRVYIALLDPDLKVSGRGVQRLRDAGIETHVGLSEAAVKQQLKAYLYHRTYNRPYTVIKTAVSIDGCTAAQDGSSQWITDERAREDVHLLRAGCQAIMVGAGTAIADNPQLNVRHPTVTPHIQPLRVICDATGKVPAQKLPTLIFTTDLCPSERIKEWETSGSEVKIVDQSEAGVNLEEALAVLGEKGVLQLLVEGGSALHTSFLKQKLVQKLVVYVGNCLLGGTGMHTFAGLDVASISEAPRFKLESCHKLGDSSKLVYNI